MKKKKAAKIISVILVVVFVFGGGFAAGTISTIIKTNSSDNIASQVQTKMNYLNKLIDDYYLDYNDNKNDEKIKDSIYKGLLNGLDDPYSVYYTKEEYQSLLESTSGSYCGIGVVVSQNNDTGVITAVRVFDGAPGDKAGVKAKDIIYKVEDEEVRSENMEPILKIENLKTSFMTSGGEVQAVRGVSFSVGKGEILGIVGESGSGKSVTSMSILRLLADTARIKDGSILFEGEDLTKLSKKQIRKIRGEKIAMIFQDPMSSLNPLIPVGKQVSEMIREHHPDKSREELKKEVMELFSRVRIPEPEKRYHSFPHEFSGGMRQRVMIAMALANKPELLIADEPTTALDVTIQDQILRQLRELEKEYGTSIIFITHDLGVVAELCDRVIVMYGGLVMEEAPIEDIFEHPSHPYTMGLLASIPDIEQNKEVRLSPIPGSPPDMTNPPKGCPFAPRCPYARSVCAVELPEFSAVGEGHYSRCFLLSPDAPADENNPFKLRSKP